VKVFVCLGIVLLTGCANGLSVDDQPAKTGSQSSDSGVGSGVGVKADGGISEAGVDCKTVLGEPWSGTGATASFVDQDTLTVINGDRYWVFDYTTATWSTNGHVELKWAAAPAIDGLLPWQGVGVRAAYVNGTTQTIISGDRMWTVDLTSGTWGAPNHLETAWSSAPANGGFKPWDSPGVQTAYVNQTDITVISADRYWVLDTSSSTWTSGTLETTWAGAPMVDSKLPWQDSGVGTAWVYGGLQTTLSADRYWISNVTSGAWTDTGHLETVWASAPAVDDCK
jgi:hypothetical protein